MNPSHRRRHQHRVPTDAEQIREAKVARGRSGYGFMLAGQYPCTLSSITPGSAAERAGLQPGDRLLRINGLNVTQVSHDDVVRLIGSSDRPIDLEILPGTDRVYEMRNGLNLNDSSSDDDRRAHGHHSPGMKVRHHRSRPRIVDLQTTYSQVEEFRDSKHPAQHDLLYPSDVGVSDQASSKYRGHRPRKKIKDLVERERKTENENLAGYKVVDQFDFQHSLRTADHDAVTDRNGPHRCEERRCIATVTAQKLTKHTLLTRDVRKGLSKPLVAYEPSSGSEFSKSDRKSVSRRYTASVDELMEVMVVLKYIGSVDMARVRASRSQTVRHAWQRLLARETEKENPRVSVKLEVDLEGIRVISQNSRVLAHFPTSVVAFCDTCPDDDRVFGVVVIRQSLDARKLRNRVVGSTCHLFVTDTDICEHRLHAAVAAKFSVNCTFDVDCNQCAEFPSLAAPVVAAIGRLYQRRCPSNSRHAHHMNGESSNVEIFNQTEKAYIIDTDIYSKHGADGLEWTSRASRGSETAVKTNAGSPIPVTVTAMREIASHLDPNNKFSNSIVNRKQVDENIRGFTGIKVESDAKEAVTITAGPSATLERLTVRAMPNLQISSGSSNSSGAQGNAGVESLQSSLCQLLDEKRKLSASDTDSVNSKMRCTDVGTEHVSDNGYRQHQELSRKLNRDATVVLSSDLDGSAFRDVARDAVAVKPPLPEKRLPGRLVSQTIISLHTESRSDHRPVVGSKGSDQIGAQKMSMAVSCKELSHVVEGSSHVDERKGKEEEDGEGGRKIGVAASWALSFDRVLVDVDARRLFTEFLRKEYSLENLVFWQKCEEYKNSPFEQRKLTAGQIYSAHLIPSAPESVNIDEETRLEVERELSTTPANLFTAAQIHIYSLMKHDSYPRFLRSDIYKQAVIAELEGKAFPCSDKIKPTSPTIVSGKVSANNRKHVDDSELMKKSKSSPSGVAVNDVSDEKRRRSALPWSKNKVEKKVTRKELENAANNLSAARSIQNISANPKPLTEEPVPAWLGRRHSLGEKKNEEQERDRKFAADCEQSPNELRKDETFFELLSRAQSRQLDDQRGTTLFGVELPDFLREDRNYNNSNGHGNNDSNNGCNNKSRQHNSENSNHDSSGLHTNDVSTKLHNNSDSCRISSDLVNDCSNLRDSDYNRMADSDALPLSPGEDDWTSGDVWSILDYTDESEKDFTPLAVSQRDHSRDRAFPSLGFSQTPGERGRDKVLPSPKDAELYFARLWHEPVLSAVHNGRSPLLINLSTGQLNNNGSNLARPGGRRCQEAEPDEGRFSFASDSHSTSSPGNGISSATTSRNSYEKINLAIPQQQQNDDSQSPIGLVKTCNFKSHSDLIEAPNTVINGCSSFRPVKPQPKHREHDFTDVDRDELGGRVPDRWNVRSKEDSGCRSISPIISERSTPSPTTHDLLLFDDSCVVINRVAATGMAQPNLSSTHSDVVPQQRQQSHIVVAHKQEQSVVEQQRQSQQQYVSVVQHGQPYSGAVEQQQPYVAGMLQQPSVIVAQQQPNSTGTAPGRTRIDLSKSCYV